MAKARYYSTAGNISVWEEGKQPADYVTEEEWEKLHPAPPPPEPTKGEKLAALDAQYDADKAEIVKYFNEAALVNDIELQDELRAEMAEIDAQYVEDRKAIEDEPEEGAE